jgi:hypothetical protein
VSDPAGLDAFMWGLRQEESSNRYNLAPESGSSASGAYQYLRSSWANYGGYAQAYLAPASVQDQKAKADLTRLYNQYHNWDQVAAAWLYPVWAGDRGKWGQKVPNNPITISQYVGKVLGYARQHDPSFGGSGGGGGNSAGDVIGGIIGTIIPGSGQIIGGGGAGDLVGAIKGIGTVLEDMAKDMAELPKVFDLFLKLLDPTVDLRIVSGFFGVAFVGIGIFLLGREVRTA